MVSKKNANFAPNYICMRMIKRLLIFTFSLAALWLVPVTASAAPAYFSGVMELMEEQEVDVAYSEGMLTVTGAEGLVLQVVTVTGNVVLHKRIDSPEQKIELNIPKGCYIVKVGKVVRRVYVR